MAHPPPATVREALGQWADEDTLCLAGTTGQVVLRESEDWVALDDVTADQPGRGFGKQLMERLKAYCDASGKQLVLNSVVSLFFGRYEWLEEIEPDEGDGATLLYRPETATQNR